jgi:hypothetical protein
VQEILPEVAGFDDLPTLTGDHQEQIVVDLMAIQARLIFQLLIEEVIEE